MVLTKQTYTRKTQENPKINSRNSKTKPIKIQNQTNPGSCAPALTEATAPGASTGPQIPTTNAIE